MKNIVLFVVSVCYITACQTEESERSTTHFTLLAPEAGGVAFANEIVENDTLNYFTFPYLYMGGGVAVGDVNNDGWVDLFFYR